MTDDTRAVVLASGGMDSATAAYEAQTRGYDHLYLLHTSYGQNTEDREYDCASALADHVDAADFLHVETGHLTQIGASSLTDDSMDVADADTDSDEIPTSYVPFRNANLLSMAVSYAEANDCGAVFIGAHSEDFSGYPDCGPPSSTPFRALSTPARNPTPTSTSSHPSSSGPRPTSPSAASNSASPTRTPGVATETTDRPVGRVTPVSSGSKRSSESANVTPSSTRNGDVR